MTLPLQTKESPARERSVTSRSAAFALLLTFVFSLLHHAGVIAAYIAPPPGYEAAGFVRAPDIANYLTWLALAREHWLLPNYHSPHPTEPALFQPMMTLLARSGLPLKVAYYGFQFILQWAAFVAWLAMLRMFCPNLRQRLFAALFTIAAIPLQLLVLPYFGAGSNPDGISFGLLEYAHFSADGLLRGGDSNSFTHSWGTASILAGVCLLARYAETRSRKLLGWLCALSLVSALFHPFEVYVIVTLAAPILLPARLWKSWAAIAVCGALGVLPYAICSLATPWLRELSKQAIMSVDAARPLTSYGLPAILLAALLLGRFLLREKRDLIIAAWLAAVVVLSYLPLPVTLHYYNGFACGLGILLARRLSEDPAVHTLCARRPRRVRTALGALALTTCISLTYLYSQVVVQSLKPDPVLLHGAVRSHEERRLLDWMKANLDRRRGLVLSPLSLSPWVATVPMPSFASHWLMSGSYVNQARFVARFYGGEQIAPSLWRIYPIRYVVIPTGSPASPPTGSKLLFESTGFRLFELN